MQKVAKFEKVSFNQFEKDYKMNNISLKNVYDQILLPKRATKYSAGYDFFLPEDISIAPKQSIIIPSGIRVWIDSAWVLKCYPRSSLGFKYQISLANTVGIIDADYYNSLNEGHILIKLTNHSDHEVKLLCGSAFMQGIFVEYGITIDDEVTTERIGGIGSTSK